MQDLIDELNRVYWRLEMKGVQMLNGLHHRIFDPKLGYYSGHYRRTEDGGFAMDRFPIPVIEVPGYCDVEIHLDRVVVSAKLRREDALNRSYEILLPCRFEAYGVDGYLDDFYRPGMRIDELKENIQKSDEREIGFSIEFDFDIDGDAIYEFVKLLRREGFYY